MAAGGVVLAAGADVAAALPGAEPLLLLLPTDWSAAVAWPGADDATGAVPPPLPQAASSSAAAISPPPRRTAAPIAGPCDDGAPLPDDLVCFVMPTTSPSLWRHPDFLKLWAGQSISQLGSQISMLAIPLAAVVTLGANAFQAGLLGTFEFLPFLLVGLPAGVWVDRMARRPVLIVADVGRCIALATIPVAAGLHSLHIAQLYAVSFVVGVLTVFFDVAYQSYLPSLVQRDRLVDGNGKLEFSRATAQIAGPGLGGALVAILTAPVAIAADAASYVASVFSLLLIRRPEEVEPGSQRRSMRAELVEGLRYVWHHKLLRPIALCTGIGNYFGNMGFAVLILFAVRDLGMSAGLIGLSFSIGSFGAPLGAATAGWVSRRIGTGWTIIASAVLFTSAAIFPPLATHGFALPPLVISGFLASTFGVMYNITQVSLRQAISPHRIQGRMNATMRFLVWGTIPLGTFTGGVLGSTLGLRTTLWISAGGYALSLIPPLFSPVRRVRSIEAAIAEYGHIADLGSPFQHVERPEPLGA
jgi:MFS family permease